MTEGRSGRPGPGGRGRGSGGSGDGGGPAQGAAGPRIALTIAGSDPSGGAGIQADLKTFAAFGVFGAAALAALTAQNTLGVRAVLALEPAFVVAQVAAVLDDLPVAALKTGMLGSTAVVAALAAVVRQRQDLPVVVDPVLAATSGDALAVDAIAPALLRELVPLARVVTPNLPEAEALSGRPVRDLASMREAARALVDRGAGAALVKGGHLERGAVDVLLDGRDWYEIEAPRLAVGPTHGTGCTLASAIAAGLARGRSLVDAVVIARAYVHAALVAARPLGHGARPLDHRVEPPAAPDRVAPVRLVAYPAGS